MIAETTYPDEWSVRQAREAYFDRHGLSAEGYRDAWVDLAVGPVPVAFPNSPARRQVVPLHDLHHVATGYAADWVGEAEIAAWELGGGCGRAWAAWILDLATVGVGALVAPRRGLRAFARGRRSRPLYRDLDAMDPGLLDLTVAELRARVAADAPFAVRASDAARFALYSALGLAIAAAGVATSPPLVVAGLWRRWTRARAGRRSRRGRRPRRLTGRARAPPSR